MKLQKSVDINKYINIELKKLIVTLINTPKNIDIISINTSVNTNVSSAKFIPSSQDPISSS